ncbi:twin-arginine translocase subunit TatC [Flavobacterium sp. xlx-214]|uniref:twin-arginine translocase subunit TatC n=1 Tax=unclassified Flavobacterium TaxID=196869 RepID=UPI0013D6964A|nr:MULTISPECIES: twin-arginine translocase subunit TatC [unclassified Flavobacterium]MBA5791236.1 twin-arginine translocase subunit TatC [Flavobacterium sp. xlx-221]QMI84890.1 twin-arginine translocase subunit TatC [Flavobacterium sp. xlx-214]
MSFLNHLEELRWLLIRSSIAILITAVIAVFFNEFIFDVIIFGPKKGDFVTYQFFCDIAQRYDLDQSFCNNELPFVIQNRTMDGQLSVMIWTCITAGFIMAFPFILWEFWKFISPALYQKERKYAKLFIFISSILFFLGVLFGYFVLVPLSINFLANFTISNIVENQIDINSYINLVKNTSLATGLVFELPIIIFFLTYLGLITDAFLKEYRRYAYVLILVVAAVVTPPDVISQLIVSFPLIILYEGSIIVAKFITKRNLKKEQTTALTNK